MRSARGGALYRKESGQLQLGRLELPQLTVNQKRAAMTLSDEGVHHQMDAPWADCVCIRCGTAYPPQLAEGVFRPRRRERVCRACERTARGQRKQRNPWMVKAHNVIRSHADRLGVDKGVLVDVYGWDPQRLAHDAEHQYAKGCSYCGEQYAGPLTSRSTFKTPTGIPTTARTPHGAAKADCRRVHGLLRSLYGAVESAGDRPAHRVRAADAVGAVRRQSTVAFLAHLRADVQVLQPTAFVVDTGVRT